jgi:hypothetical protein
MPRKASLIISGSAHHVMTRGLDGQGIFHDGEDRKKLAALLGNYWQAAQ